MGMVVQAHLASTRLGVTSLQHSKTFPYLAILTTYLAGRSLMLLPLLHVGGGGALSLA